MKKLFLIVAVLAVSATFAIAQSWKYETDGKMDATNTIQTLIDVVSATITYVGKAQASASRTTACWQVMRVYTQDTITCIQFYNGDAGYRGVWDQRASATYK